MASESSSEVLQGPHQGKEVMGVVAVGLGGMVFQVALPFLPHEGLQQLLHHGLDPLLHFFYRFLRGFCFAYWPSPLSFPVFSGKATMLLLGYTS